MFVSLGTGGNEGKTFGNPIRLNRMPTCSHPNQSKCTLTHPFKKNSPHRLGMIAFEFTCKERFCRFTRLPTSTLRTLVLRALPSHIRTLQIAFGCYVVRFSAPPRGMCHFLNSHRFSHFGCKGTAFCRHVQEFLPFECQFVVICRILQTFAQYRLSIHVRYISCSSFNRYRFPLKYSRHISLYLLTTSLGACVSFRNSVTISRIFVVSSEQNNPFGSSNCSSNRSPRRCARINSSCLLKYREDTCACICSCSGKNCPCISPLNGIP